jgi:hypothetical protein
VEHCSQRETRAVTRSLAHRLFELYSVVDKFILIEGNAASPKWDTRGAPIGLSGSAHGAPHSSSPS